MGLLKKVLGLFKGLRLGSIFLGVGAGFVFGFISGAAIVAILDYRDEKIAHLYKLRHDTDENYIYSE